jgi:glycine betaine transporter
MEVGSAMKKNPVLVLSLLSVGMISIWALIDSHGIANVMESYSNYVLGVLNWAFLFFCTSFIVIVIAIAISKYGELRLGKDDEKPEFSTASWISMLFAAGMGSSLINYSVAEPMYHFIAPPGQEGLTQEAIGTAFSLTYLHWGLHPWAIYAICSLIVAYFTFRKGTGTLVSAPIFYAFRGVINQKFLNWLCVGGEVIAVIAVVCGLAGSLVFGVLSVRAGMHYTIGTDITSTQLSVVIMAVMTVLFLISASTSLDKGILIVSNINSLITVLLLAFVIFLGPTNYILATFINSIGDYMNELVELSFRLSPGDEERQSWTLTWTLSYFLWWLAWGPFVGVFIARISRGRTIREFVLGVMIIPTVFSMLWFASFGGAGIYIDNLTNGVLTSIVYEDMTRGFFVFFEYFPATTIFHVVATVLMFTYLVTSADSGTYVVSSMTSKGDLNPSPKLKLIWGVIIAALTTGVLLTESWEASRALAIFGAIPFSVFIILQLVAFFRVLPEEFADAPAESEGLAVPEPVPEE